jgi:dihydroorotate dehydrogenase
MSKESLRSFDGHDSEKWHVRSRRGLHLAQTLPGGLKLLEKLTDQKERFTHEKLHIVMGGIEFENPLMVGAGWDKLGEAVSGLHQLGFAGVEVGSVLALAQPGNEKPRQWMIAPGVSLNRLGFNSPGMEIVAKNLKKYQLKGLETGVIGISIGKNKDVPDIEAPEFHFMVAQRLYKYADYFAINVSSPNTPGLRNLQDKKPLTDIVQAVNHAMFHEGNGENWRKPIFVKIAPDNLSREAIDDIIDVVVENKLTGIIATNTIVSSELKAKYGQQWKYEPGGLAGDDPDYRRISTEMVKHIYRETNGQIEIIGVGGIKDTETALEKIKAGAKVIQIVTGIRGSLPLRKAIFTQPKLPGKINREIVQWMNREGIGNIREIVGIDVN